MIFSVLGLAAMLGGVGGAGSYAFWTDAEQIDTAELAAGTLDLQVESTTDGVVHPLTTLSFSDMAPTESVAATVGFSNRGSTPFRWQLRGRAGTGPLDASLTYTVRVGAAVSIVRSTFPKQSVCTTAAPSFELWSGKLSGSLANLGSVSSGALSSGDVRILCISASLDRQAGDEVQGATTSATFELVAEQVLPETAP